VKRLLTLALLLCLPLQVQAYWEATITEVDETATMGVTDPTQPEGSRMEYITVENAVKTSVDADDIDDTATTKKFATAAQLAAIATNSDKTGITSGQASAITANTAKVTNTALTVQEEGSDLDTAVDTLNFIGAGVTAVEGADHTINVTVASGAGDTQAAVDESITGLWNFKDSGAGGLTDYDITVGDTDGTPTYGLMRIGNATFGRTSFGTGNLDLDGSLILWNNGTPATSNIEFAFAESNNSVRFAIPKSGAGNGTYNPRSMIIAGPAPADDTMVTVGYWQTQSIFDNLVMDTGTDGADLGVQNDLEVEGDIFTDSIKGSTDNTDITITPHGTGDVIVSSNIEAASFVSSAADGAHYGEAINTVAITATATEGRFAYLTDRLWLADGTDWTSRYLFDSDMTIPVANIHADIARDSEISVTANSGTVEIYVLDDCSTATGMSTGDLCFEY